LPVAGSQAAIQALPLLRALGRVGVLTPGYAEHAQAWQRAALREASLDRLADARAYASGHHRTDTTHQQGTGMQHLILGGARSGKSALAERIALTSGLAVTYLATAQAFDDEMQRRIAHHRSQRSPQWQCVEEPIALAATLQAHAAPDCCVLVDCLTLWLSNLLGHPDAGVFARERDALLATLPQLPGQIVLVSNEVGQGIVPLGELTRRFVNEAGWLHQALALQCERVVFVVAGLPMVLKGEYM
ncbi:bifunctional adenosylcobinamide kinase/adenosylcobinamide-phosphate guanylyltransferase, partial [Xanthomonas oryzae]